MVDNNRVVVGSKFKILLVVCLTILLIACDGMKSGELKGDSYNPAGGIPTADAGINQIVTFPTDNVMLSGVGQDSDGQVVEYRWVQVSGPSSARFENSSNASSRARDLVPGTYVFQLTVRDNRNFSGSDTIVITVLPPVPNSAPRAAAGTNQTITLPVSAVSLNGSGTDSDGTIARYQWSQISGPSSANFASPTSAATSVTGLVAGTYAFRLLVTDDDGDTGSDSLIITVMAAPPLLAPQVDAGPNRAIIIPANSIILNGSGTDADGTITSYVWNQVSGPGTATLVNMNTSTLTATNLVLGTYVFRLVATDNHGLTGEDTATVVVNPAANVPPVANAGAPQIITLPTSSILLNGTGTDPDGSIASFAWVQLSGPSSATLTNANSAGMTASQLMVGVYVFRLTVTDNSGITASDSVNVTVNPAPNIPPTASAGPDRTITLPTNSVTLSGSANDPDGTIVSYSWSQVSGPASATLSGATTATLIASSLIAGSYIFQISVMDNRGAAAVNTATVTVNPAPPNAPPVNDAGVNQTVILPANSATLIGSASDSDGTIASYLWTQESGPSAATLSGTGSPTLNVNGMIAGTYVFKFVVTDNGGASATDTASVLVISPPNQAPTANAGADRNITLPTSVVTLPGSATDPDGTIASYFWSQISGPTTALLSNRTTNTLTASTLSQGTYVFRLTATDNAGATNTDDVIVIVNP